MDFNGCNRLQCKVELHTHFDGALRAETIIELARAKGIDMPVDNVRQLKEVTSCVNEENKSLEKFLQLFPFFYAVIRGDRKVLRRCALEFCEDQAKQGALYSEVRFLPQLLISQKSGEEVDPENDCLTNDQVIQVLLDGFAEGSHRYGIKVKSLLSCYRPLPELAAETVELCKKYRTKGIIGLDIAGDPNTHPHKPDDEFVKAFQEAKKFGIHRTVHAGESGSAENVRQMTILEFEYWNDLRVDINSIALDWLHAERIGHGYYVVQDEELYKTIKRNGIHMELCPTSSLLTGAVPSFENHPAKRFIKEGLNFSINSDDPVCCNCGIDDEYKLVHNEWGYDYSILTKSTFNAAHSSFLPEEEKKQLIEQLEIIYGMK